MNGMKHVPPPVISSARIRDLLEIDNVAQGESGSPSEGQFVAIVHRPSSPSSSAKAKAASGAKSGRPFGAPTIDNARRLQIEALLRRRPRHPHGRTNDRLRKRHGRQDQARDRSRRLILYAIEQKGASAPLFFARHLL
jgi:hypothetical protein